MKAKAVEFKEQIAEAEKTIEDVVAMAAQLEKERDSVSY